MWALSDQAQHQTFAPQVVGPVLQCTPIVPNAKPTQLAANGNWQSGIIVSGGYKAISVGVTLQHAGTLSMQRYIDEAGLVPVGAAISASLTAATPGYVDVNDGVAFASFQITLTDTSDSTNNVTNLGILLNAA